MNTEISGSLERGVFSRKGGCSPAGCQTGGRFHSAVRSGRFKAEGWKKRISEELGHLGIALESLGREHGMAVRDNSAGPAGVVIPLLSAGFFGKKLLRFLTGRLWS